MLPSRELGTTSIPYSPSREPASAPHQPLAPPSGPLAYGGGAEGRKRRSPSSYKGKPSKLSRPGGLESLFGNGSDGGGILASGPESPRQVEVTYRRTYLLPGYDFYHHCEHVSVLTFALAVPEYNLQAGSLSVLLENQPAIHFLLSK